MQSRDLHARRRWTLAALLAAGLVVTDAVAAPKQAPFGRAQFEEVLQVLGKQYIEKELKAPHIWAAAANGAVTALWDKLPTEAGKNSKAPRRKIELLPSSFVALKKFSETRFSGKTTPFSCQGRSLPGVVVHEVPRRKKGAKPYGQGGNSSGEPLVDALLAWPPPFSKQDFECVVTWVEGQLIGRSEPIGKKVAAGARIKRLPDEEARQRRVLMWLRAARWLLRSLDPHSKLTTVQTWAAVNAPVDVVTREQDVTSSDLPGKPGFLRITVRKFAPGGDERVRDAIGAAKRRLHGKGGLRGIVLDMRGNGGGILPVAVGLVETFMRGGLVTRVKTRDAVAAVKVSRKRREVVDTPLVVLVNERCASACEFTSGALQDGLRALVVGERTYGKATLQEYTELKTTQMKVMVTTAMFFSPTGHPIQAEGVAPDVEVAKRADGKLSSKNREEDVPFHLTAETMADERDTYFFLPWVRACADKSLAADRKQKDPQLARAATVARCLVDVLNAFDAGQLGPVPVVKASGKQ